MAEVKTLNEYIMQAIQCDNGLFERKQEKQVEETLQTDHDIRKGLIIPNTPIETCLAHIKLIMPKKTLSLTTQVGSEASSCFINEGFVQKHGILVLWKNRPVAVKVVDGRPLASGNITMEITPLRVHLGDHESHICFNVISSPIHPVIIGTPWLKKHNPNINWEKNKITHQDIQKNVTYVEAKAFI
ncbi:hypothetical protein KP509_36G042100, partial [Ceratopteris richardii]